MKQYSRIVTDSICDSRILSEIRGYFHEQGFTNSQRSEQTGPVGRTDLRVSQQRDGSKKLVQRERCLRADLLQMVVIIAPKGTIATDPFPHSLGWTAT